VYKTNTNRSLRSALLLGAASAAALSMTVPASAQDSGSVETVVVTGSRIPQQGLYSSSPVTAVGQQEIKFEGTTNVENLLNNLPSVVADQNSTVANGATGTANIDLRGLGAVRTLVLIDGKRLMPGDPADPAADVNQIPVNLVDHVEVLTGGASAVYGSDALAGVVNFIMRKDFEGIEVDGQYTVNQADNGNSHYDALNKAAGFAPAQTDWWGGETAQATLIVGSNSPDGKGNVTAYVGYQNTQPVLESDRDFSACTIATATGHVCAGSANYNTWLSVDNYAHAKPYLFFETGTGKPGSGKFVPYTGAPSQSFNYGALNYLQRPDTRYNGGFFGHYDISKEAQLFANFMFTDDHTIAQIAPSGLFLGSGTVSGYAQEVNCSNPLMTTQERDTLCGPTGTGATNLTPGQALLEIGRRDLEGGDRQDDLRHTSYRMVVGLKGDLGNSWNYEVFAQYGVSLFNETYDNEFSKSRVQNALEVDPTTGKCYAAEPAAGTGIISDPNCVPLDIFNGFGSITKSMLNYVAAQGFQEGYTQEQVVGGNLTGDLGEWGIQSPWAKNPVAVSLGTEYRDEQINLKTDYEFQSNDLYGQGSPTLPVPTSGFDVVEGFGEVQVPIVQGLPFVEDFSANGSYRYSSYSTAGATTSYKYGAEWQVIDDFKLRGSFNRAVRAPNVLELFSPSSVGLVGLTDPCSAAGDPTAAVIANCKKEGVTNAGAAILNCPAAQCGAETGGNPNLKPEISDTRTAGVVFTPTFIDGFTATLDYFDIKVDGFISGIDPSTTLSECYGASATAASQAFFCPLVHRNALHQVYGNGYVSALGTNTGFLSTKGWDLEGNYNANFDDWGLNGWGGISFNFLGTLTNSNEEEPLPGLGVYNCTGRYGDTCGEPQPRWRHKLRVTWSAPWDFDVSLDWRHLGGSKLDSNSTNPLLGGGGAIDPYDASIPAYDYFDLAVDWTVKEGVQLHAGVNNLFDKEPPVLSSDVAGPPLGNGNTFPGVYDSLGRTIFVGATIKN
jgi:outer membrane receptor protein involved in Fe transport